MTIRRGVLTTRKREDFDSVVLSSFRYTLFELCYTVVFIVQAIVKVQYKDKVIDLYFISEITKVFAKEQTISNCIKAHLKQVEPDRNGIIGR